MSAWTGKKHDLTRQAASEIAAGRAGDECEWTGLYPVSYTHLTLPTKA